MNNMYRCAGCGRVCEESELVRVEDSFARVASFAPYDACPSCGDDFLEEVKECPHCNQYYAIDEQGLDGDFDGCNACFDGAMSALDKFLAGTATDMTREEKDIIREWKSCI